MKHILAILFLLTVTVSVAFADSTIFGSLSTISTASTNSAVFQTNTISVPIGKLQIANGGLAITNAISGTWQFSLDKTNYFPLGASYTPTVTNATTDTIQPQAISVPVYLRYSVSTNNANTVTPSVGATYTSP